MIAHAAIDVLVVEDNEVSQQVMSMILDMAGFSYRVVDDGALAVAAFRTWHPRLVLMDIDMPAMNGWDATLAIRAAETDTDRRVPIIALTAHAMHGDREKCLCVGMDDYLQKPVPFDALVSAINARIGPAALAPQLIA